MCVCIFLLESVKSQVFFSSMQPVNTFILNTKNTWIFVYHNVKIAIKLEGDTFLKPKNISCDMHYG